jgi:hypothetical protein
MALTRTPGITLGSDGRFFIDKRYRGVRISPTQELPLVNVRSWPGLPVRRARRQPPLARRVVSTEVRSRRRLSNPGPGPRPHFHDGQLLELGRTCFMIAVGISVSSRK